MKISNDKVVSIEYTLKNADGQIIDTSVGNAPLEYIHGRGYLISGLEKDLEGKSEGEEFTSEIEPKDVIAWQNHLLAFKRANGKGYSASYLRKI